jgi:thioredoxin 1
VWKNPEEAEKYNIKSIPTQIFFDANGKEISRHTGFISEEDILKVFEKQGELN